MLGMARLRRLFNRARVDKIEINILRGILKSVENMTPPTHQQVTQDNYGSPTKEQGDADGHA